MKKMKFRSIELNVRRLINNYGSGIHHGLMHDNTGDVDSARVYQAGDKRLDAKASLQANRICAKTNQSENPISIFLIVDTSASQFINEEFITSICCYFNYLAEMSNEEIGLITFSDKVGKIIEPCLDYGLITQAIMDIEIDNDHKTDFEKPIRMINNYKLQNTLFVIISDFCCKIDHVLLRTLSNDNNSCISLILKNQINETFNFSISTKDAESAKTASLDLKHQANDDWYNSIKNQMRKSLCHPVVIDTNHNNPLLSLVKFLLKVK